MDGESEFRELARVREREWLPGGENPGGEKTSDAACGQVDGF